MKKVYVVFQRLNQISNLVKVACLGFFLMGSSTYVFAVSVGGGAVQTVQQSKTIMGVVVDESGEPIIGANIKVDGSTIGTITDLNGRFSLEVPAGGKVSVSYIGYISQTVLPKQGKDFKIVLKEDAKTLDEVVVIGYGSQKAKNVTGSVATISPKDFEDLPVSNLSEALSGKIPGLTVSGGASRPGEAATLKIRQSFSLSKDGGNEVPLVIIDDVIQVDEDGLATLEQFNMLDPSEIESISVLRDASAAIYGSRASQGAIIVKTKRGTEGKVKINYSGQFSLNDAVGHSKSMNAYEYGVFANSFLTANGTTSASNLFSDSELEQMKSINYDWLDKAWSSASAMRHNVNVSGGSSNVTYFAGASYYNQGANMGSQDYNKWTFRSGLDVKLQSNLKLSVSLSANEGNQEKSFTKGNGSISDSSYGAKCGGEQADYGLLLHMPKYIPWSYNIDGEDYWVSPALGPHKTGSATSANVIGGWNYFGQLKNGSKQTTNDFSYTANFALAYDIPFVKGLSVRATYSKGHTSDDTEQVQMPITLARSTNSASTDTHLYTDATTWEIKQNTSKARVVYTNNISENKQMNFYLNYDRKFGLHSISAMASVERAETAYKSKTLLYNNPEENQYLGTSATAGTLDTDLSSSSRSEGGTLSYLGRLSYSYADKYLAQFIFREDASTKFAPENYWGFFPTLSLGWVISEEQWFKDKLPWVDFFKLRASLGKTGKDNIKAWRWIQTYDYSASGGMTFGTTSGGTLGSGLTTGSTPNRNAAWDKTIKQNIGFDAKFLDARLGVGFDYYYDRNRDMLMTLSSTVGTPISTGGGYAEENYGAIDAWGTEITLSWRDKIGKVQYSVAVNFGTSGNKVKKYPEQAVAVPSSNTIKEGGSYDQFPAWGFRTWKETSSGDGILRTDNDVTNYWNYLTENATAAGNSPSYLGITSVSKMKKGMLAYQDLYGDLNDDGTMESGANGKIESGKDYDKLVKKNKSHGFTTNLGLSWKGLSWTAQISTNWGTYKNIDNVKQGSSSNQIIWSHESYLTDMYDETNNVDGKYPNIAYYSYTGYASDFWQVHSFRCYIKNMSIGYTVPKAWISKVGIEQAKISLTGNNLWDFYNPYPDHYRNMYDNSYASYPTLRTWSLGVNLTF